MRYALKRSGGEVAAYSDTPIVVDGDVFRSGRLVWADPRPSDGGYVEQVASVPGKVSMAQARIALSRAGVSEAAVDAVISAMPDGQAKTEAQIWWDKSNEVWRTSATVALLAPALNLTEDDIDALFIAASGIEA